MNIAIFSVTAGHGHHATAAAMKEALALRGHTVQVVDMLSVVNRYLQRAVDKGYSLSIKYTPKSYGRAYEFLYRNASLKNDVVEFLTSEFIIENAYQAVVKLTPDLILSTHVFASQILDELLHRKYIKTPHIGIVTDFTIHPTWEALRHVNYIVTASPYLNSRAKRCGLQPEKVLPLGIPVQQKFTVRGDMSEARRELGLEPGLKTVLVMSGSMGYGHLQKTVVDIANSGLPMQLLVVCGSNQRAERELIRMNFPMPVRIMGYVNNIDRLMDAADIVITKPGGLSVSEALAKGKPMILFDPIPGQEKQNAEFLSNAGLALNATDTMPPQELLALLFEEPRRWEQIVYAVENFAPRGAAGCLCDMIEEKYCGNKPIIK